jgi:hypothetical protein
MSRLGATGGDAEGESASVVKQTCPRRVTGFGPWARDEGLDEWDNRTQLGGGIKALHCSFCGSLHPDTFMELLEQGAELGPTDKSYKAYIRRVDSEEPCDWCEGTGEQTNQVDGKCPMCRGTKVRAAGPETKFYYPHLSIEQQDRFIELHNSGRLRIGYPGRLYRVPFFARRASGGA